MTNGKKSFAHEFSPKVLTKVIGKGLDIHEIRFIILNFNHDNF